MPADESPSVELVSHHALEPYTLPGYPWPWVLFALVVRMSVDATAPDAFRAVPCFLLAPGSHVALDATALETWVSARPGDARGADEALLKRLPMKARPWVHQWNLHEATDAGRRTLEWARAKLSAPNATQRGCRHIAERQPWTFLFGGVLERAAALLEVPERDPGMLWSLDVLRAAKRTPRPRGRPPEAPSTSLALALRDEVPWLRRQSGRRDSVARDVVDLAASQPSWAAPLWGGQAVEVEQHDRLSEAVRKRRKRLRRAHAVPQVIPFVAEAWDLTTPFEDSLRLSRWLELPGMEQRRRVICGDPDEQESRATLWPRL